MDCSRCRIELDAIPVPRGVSGRVRDFLAAYRCRKCGRYFDKNGKGDVEVAT